MDINIKKSDGIQIAVDFINYFYTLFSSEPSQLFEIIKPYTKLRYLNETYEGEQFIKKLSEISINGLEFIDYNVEILDSGSRQIYILVLGHLKEQTNIYKFSQTFMITYTGENIKKSSRKWILMNSLLLINL